MTHAPLGSYLNWHSMKLQDWTLKDRPVDVGPVSIDSWMNITGIACVLASPHGLWPPTSAPGILAATSIIAEWNAEDQTAGLIAGPECSTTGGYSASFQHLQLQLARLSNWKGSQLEYRNPLGLTLHSWASNIQAARPHVQNASNEEAARTLASSLAHT